MSDKSVLIQQLDDLFADHDRQIEEADVVWALDRQQAVREFWKTYKSGSIPQSQLYDKLFAMAGGKTWYNLFQGNSSQAVEEAVRKNAKAVAQKRNFRIADKLLKSGVDSIDSMKVVYSKDGFNGAFRINDKTVTIESILAGGPVQRLHQRVLVKVK